MQLLRNLLTNQEGTAVIEFAMLCGFIVLAIIGAIVGLGTETGFSFATLANKVADATAAS